MNHAIEIRLLNQLIAVLLMVALFWLSIGSTLALGDYQQIVQTNITSDEMESTDNPLQNIPEEKSESQSNSFSEYLHDNENELPDIINNTAIRKCHSSDLYFRYHPDLISPPPDIWS